MSDDREDTTVSGDGDGDGTDIEGAGLLDEPGLDTDLGDPGTGAVGRTEPGPSRLAGLLALVLGLVGSLVAIVAAFLFLRLLFGASGAADTAMDPVAVSFERLEQRIDQTDDLVDREGIPDDRVEVLRARVDGLVDVSTAARQGFIAVDDHPMYRLLPAELATLGDALTGFRDSAETIDDALGAGPTVRPAVAAQVADEVDTMQGDVSDTRALIDDATSSLRRWIRLGSLLGFVVALWGLWGQLVLARRGWRGTRARAL